jgi:hypothetical protein
MRSRRITPLSIVWSCLPLALAMILATPTATFAIGDWIGVEGSMWRQTQDGTASIDGDILGGTTIDFQDTLGLEADDDTLMGRVWFRFGRTHINLDYFDSERGGDTILTQSFTFNDTVYTAGQAMSSDLRLKLYQAHFLFSIINVKVVDFGLGFGANQADVDMALDGSVSGLTTLEESVPYPTLAGYITIKPAPAFHIKAEVTGVKGDMSGTHVDVLDGRAQIELYVAHVLGFFAGYRQFHFEVEDEGFGSIDNTFKGPYAGIGLKF